MAETTAEKLDEIVAAKGGRRLRTSCTNTKSKVRLMCQQGHTWVVQARSILYEDSWCPECSQLQKNMGMDGVRELAEKYGGRCLAKNYVNNRQMLEWECGEGHVFKRPTYKVQAGQWCFTCQQANMDSAEPLTMGDLVEHARKCGVTHIGTATTLREVTRWRCDQEHEFEVSGRAIRKRKNLCQECAGRSNRGLEDIQVLARNRGGRCLSGSYDNSCGVLKFECEKGHRWKTMARNVMYCGSWCPTCAKIRGNLDSLKEIAEEREGMLLSTEYENSRTHYEWRCRHGHVFSSTPKLARKRWCRSCPPEPIPTIHEKVARRWGGECKNQEKNLWRCEDGHDFSASTAAAWLSWCPICRLGDWQATTRSDGCGFDERRATHVEKRAAKTVPEKR